MKTAVMYLRVSSAGQVKTDYDPEGISIPAQRQACLGKAQQLGVQVIDEYVEPGKSATTIAKRPVFQQMMARLKQDRDVDYVIVYNLSRLNRNRVDDVMVLSAMRGMGVTLISAQESIDETPAGQLMHGMLAVFNEYNSMANGADIKNKMGHKAKNGGTLGKAPLGYLNVRDRFEGREVRTVAIDDERAPFVRLAFELYASGDYTLGSLADELTHRGLRTRGDSRTPAQPVAANRLHRMLRDRYYLGLVTYKGIEYPGRHPALVEQTVFDAVQMVLDGRGPSTGRQRKHDHYLKGVLWCAVCHDQGVDSRMIMQRAIGKSRGEYWYFFCIRRQHHACDAPYIPSDVAEVMVQRHYEGIVMPEGFAGDVRGLLDQTLADDDRAGSLLRCQLSDRLAAIEVQEENLLDLAADGALPQPKIRERLRSLADERARVTGELEQIVSRLTAGAQVMTAAIGLISDVPELYRQSSDEGRRLINQVFFERLYVEYDKVREERLRLPFDELLYLRRRPRYDRPRPGQRKTGALVGAGLRESHVGRLEAAVYGRGSSKATMVELRGLEPLTPSLRTRCATSCATAP
jgi:site-specific DNA recombinase